MALRDKVKGIAINALLSGGLQRTRRGLHEVRQRVARAESKLELYYQVDDPYSHLLAQLVPRLMDRYGVGCELIVIGHPAHDAVPVPALRATYAVRDARELATYYDLDFPNGPDKLEEGPITRANQVLVIERPAEQQLRAAQAVGAALWANDKNAMTRAMGDFGTEASGKVKPVLAENYALLRKRGHYWGGMLRYKGEWYWGIDRLHYLEAALGGGEPLLRPRPESARPPERLHDGDGPLAVDFYHSIRSPYSYLALERMLALPRKYDLELRIKPVLPMAMRGFKVPLNKRLYIVLDAKREADRLGIPMGKICDPLGPGIERCMAVFQYASAAGRGGDFLLSVGRGVWSEALNVASDDDLKLMVERAGLSWASAKQALADDSYQTMCAENRDELTVAGLWGVPSFRAGTFSTWGQDRIEILEDRLRRHFAATRG